jgi:hypothetical protein
VRTCIRLACELRSFLAYAQGSPIRAAAAAETDMHSTQSEHALYYEYTSAVVSPFSHALQAIQWHLHVIASWLVMPKTRCASWSTCFVLTPIVCSPLAGPPDQQNHFPSAHQGVRRGAHCQGGIADRAPGHQARRLRMPVMLLTCTFMTMSGQLGDCSALLPGLHACSSCMLQCAR